MVAPYKTLNNSDVESIQMIDKVVDEYDLDYKQPRELALYEYEIYRQQNYIPEFTDVSVGQTWKGRNREADFIKDLHLKPMPAGKNSRKAQVKSIARSCEWTDDKENQILILTHILSKRLPKPKSTRTHKFEKQIETVLLYYLQKKEQEGTVFTTTSNKFFKDIQAIPRSYQEYHNYEIEIDGKAISDKELHCQP